MAQWEEGADLTLPLYLFQALFKPKSTEPLTRQLFILFCLIADLSCKEFFIGSHCQPKRMLSKPRYLRNCRLKGNHTIWSDHRRPLSSSFTLLRSSDLASYETGLPDKYALQREVSELLSLNKSAPHCCSLLTRRTCGFRPSLIEIGIALRFHYWLKTTATKSSSAVSDTSSSVEILLDDKSREMQIHREYVSHTSSPLPVLHAGKTRLQFRFIKAYRDVVRKQESCHMSRPDVHALARCHHAMCSWWVFSCQLCMFSFTILFQKWEWNAFFAFTIMVYPFKAMFVFRSSL